MVLNISSLHMLISFFFMTPNNSQYISIKLWYLSLHEVSYQMRWGKFNFQNLESLGEEVFIHHMEGTAI